VSLAEHPVFVDGEWWGAIGFDDCVLVREWNGEELGALRAASTVLGAAIQRQRGDERARATESRYQQFVEHIPAVTYMDVEDGDEVRLGFVSPQVEDLLGYPADRFVDDPGFWFSIVHPDDRARVDAAADRNAPDPFDLEYRMIAADGRIVWVHDTSNESGDPAPNRSWQGFLVDVTARRRIEERLRETEERYRALVEHIPAVVYVESPDGDPERFYVSPQVVDVFGYPVEAWRRTNDFWIDHVHPDDRPMVESDDERTSIERSAFSLDYRFLAADGTWRWIHDEAAFLHETDGKGYWQGFMLDITERKRVEAQLRDAELKFRTIVEQNEAVFYTQEIDPNDPTVSYTTYVAPGHTNLVGYSIEDLERDPELWRRIIHPEDRERVLSADAASRVGGEDRFSLEYRMVRKDGRVVWVQDQAALVRLPGKPPYWQGFLLDVTERKVAEEQIARALDVEREAAKRLRALDEMKNTFLQAVSHDLRTPLAAILGLAITLERGDVQLEADDAHDLAGRIAENARKLDRLVTNLLDMDRLARGIVTPKLEPLDVAELVRSVVAGSDLIEPSRLTLDLRRAVIPVDASKIERIVENLLANTARHTPSNARVWVSVGPEGDGVLIRVEDSGVGVPPEIRESIFEPFQQGPSAPLHSPGVGVGLTLVRRFAELHSGMAWVEEREGGGASFRIFLPDTPPVEVAT
jgi:PAS domain S-box-containing protein